METKIDLERINVDLKKRFCWCLKSKMVDNSVQPLHSSQICGTE